MERLTHRYTSGIAWASIYKISACGENECKGPIIDRLAAYEDTGLEPEEVTAIKCALMGQEIAKITEFDGISVKHLIELTQAEKDGRLVVLPCKVGDIVWMIVNKRPKIHMPEFSFVKKSRLTWNNMHRILEAFGKTVFLTRAEAEAALERQKEVQHDD